MKRICKTCGIEFEVALDRRSQTHCDVCKFRRTRDSYKKTESVSSQMKRLRFFLADIREKKHNEYPVDCVIRLIKQYRNEKLSN